jgi:proline dehydrogenase
MPGEELADALAAAERLRDEGLGSVLTLLGENLESIDEAVAVAEHYTEALREIRARGLPTEISVKLTQLGLDLDPERCAAFVDALATEAAAVGTWLWIDMEGSAYTDRTIALYERTRVGHEQVGLCLQAYLHRTPADVERLRPLRPSIRLVKGAYDEPAAIAYRRREDVDRAFLGLAVELLAGVADGTIGRAILGTHDTRLVDQATRFAEARGLSRERIEVQMLYGIRTREQRRLRSEGYAVRALISYGSSWYPWYMRRLAERPANVLFALRALLPSPR